ncbi:MAG: membrane protein insertion efficiency factor YidD [Ilumatobacter sp.]|uniref:membrane protein insertion efficiency factor YidD n=1 Tax=Ilumatobacter sp. TaxID=1967498 RepID=UPI00391AEC88
MPDTVTPDETWARRRALAAIRWYQVVREGRPSPCRFTPSCSAYAYEAFEIHGTRRASWLTLRRLLRCRPFGPSGFDPVPEPPAAVHGTPFDGVDAREHHADHPDCKDC